MKELSPEARKVFEAFNSKFDWVEDGVPGPQFKAIAAALCAVANQLFIEQPFGDTDADVGVFSAHHAIRVRLLEIADELDAQ